MKNSAHKLILKTGEAIWNDDVKGVVAIVHAIGPNYQGKTVDKAYYTSLENTIQSIQQQLDEHEQVMNVALPLISANIYRPIDLNMRDYMVRYVGFIRKHLANYTVYLNLYTKEEEKAYNLAIRTKKA